MNDRNDGQVRMSFRDGFLPGFRFEGDELLWDVMNTGDRTAEPGEVVDLVDVYPAQGSPWRLEAPVNERVEPGTAATNRVRLESSLPDGMYRVQLSLARGADGVEGTLDFAIVRGRPTLEVDSYRESETATAHTSSGTSQQGVVMGLQQGMARFRLDGNQLCWDVVNNGDTAAEPGQVTDLVDVYPTEGTGWRVEAVLQERVEPGTAATNRVPIESYPDGDYKIRIYLQSGTHGVELETEIRVEYGRPVLPY